MPVRSSFTAGEVLTAADLTDTFASKVDYALTANAQSGTGASAYTFVLADASRLTTATGTSAKTFTIPPQANVAWVANTIIRVANYGTGDLTIAGGSGVTVTNATKTLAQFESAALVRTGSNAWTLIPFSGGVGNADFSNAATGTYTDSGINYKYVTFTASGTLTVTKAGFADVLVVGGGGGGNSSDVAGFAGGGGGAGGHLVVSNAYLPASTLTITVGAGGIGNTFVGSVTSGNASRLGSYFSPGGGKAAGVVGTPAQGISPENGGSGGGNYAGAGGSGLTDLGNNGGGGVSSAAGGGGGASAVGAAGTSGVGGAGGAGTANSFTGSSVTRAGGGGGGTNTGTGGAGGSGGGGAGGTSGGTAGTVNTGGGGGGSGNNVRGGNGGSGVVIVRVKV